MRTDNTASLATVILVVLKLPAAVLLLTITTEPPEAAALPDHCGIFDVIVIGSEPEGVSAAVAAAESGARTLLITRDEIVGGLFTLGQMNVLDLRTQPFDYQLGLFDRWWRKVGRRHSFDVDQALHAFDEMLNETEVTINLGAEHLVPVQDGTQVLGVDTGATVHYATQLIDATADMDFAAAAGASYTVGFESIGLQERMADTLVFRIAGIDWQELRLGIRDRGGAYAAVDNWVAWGHFDRYPAQYEPLEDGLRLRGLNLGRQEGGTVLVNALLIYGIDPFDADSRAEGRDRAEREAPRVVDYLSRELPGFADAQYAGSAPGIYVRESRHLQAECVLTVDDVLDNRVTELDVVAGGYPLDVQTLTPADSGFVFGVPEIYGVRLCSAVPVDLDSLWVVGKAAGFDPLAASSARVVPFGMAFAEAVGVAAAFAADSMVGPEQFVNDENLVRSVRSSLRDRGAVLPEVTDRDPVGPHEHPAYEAFRILLRRGLAVPGYENDPLLDEPVPAIGYVYLLSNIATRFLADSDAGQELVNQFAGLDGQLTAAVADQITMAAACLLHAACAQGDSPVEEPITDQLEEDAVLTRGEMYQLAVAVTLPDD